MLFLYVMYMTKENKRFVRLSVLSLTFIQIIVV